MDPLRSYLGRLLQEEITPVIMVLSTPLYASCSVPVRTASDQPYRLQMFKLRLAYTSDIHLQNYEVTVYCRLGLLIMTVCCIYLFSLCKDSLYLYLQWFIKTSGTRELQ
ncbi:hypothetical protein B296_00023086 [Ensete ventricosum]|uniref:Uncharacterized protein n=1 Tax=Ensete ventricosum TaxID=4639 RepID=A0A427AHU8_ENSVE|nr:hypothetical protein B296_00023086 [Ensete ventricosum]